MARITAEAFPPCSTSPASFVEADSGSHSLDFKRATSTSTTIIAAK